MTTVKNWYISKGNILKGDIEDEGKYVFTNIMIKSLEEDYDGDLIASDYKERCYILEKMNMDKFFTTGNAGKDMKSRIQKLID